MVALIILVIVEILGQCIPLTSALLKDLPNMTFHLENHVSSWIEGVALGSLFDTAYEFGVILIVIKFIRKGINQYVLYIDGDPDADPLQLLIGFFRAMAIAIGFDVLYQWYARFMIGITNEALKIIEPANKTFNAKVISTATLGLFDGIIFIIFFVMFFKLFFQFIQRGINLLYLRIGIPIAAIGVMDANDGIFRNYIQKILQESLAITIQIFSGQFGVALMVNGHPLIGVGVMITAVNTPQSLREFIEVYGNNGGATTKAYYAAKAASSIRKFIK